MKRDDLVKVLPTVTPVKTGAEAVSRYTRHPGEGRGPVLYCRDVSWIPASAGMTMMLHREMNESAGSVTFYEAVTRERLTI